MRRRAVALSSRPVGWISFYIISLYQSFYSLLYIDRLYGKFRIQLFDDLRYEAGVVESLARLHDSHDGRL